MFAPRGGIQPFIEVDPEELGKIAPPSEHNMATAPNSTQVVRHGQRSVIRSYRKLFSACRFLDPQLSHGGTYPPVVRAGS
jgi:hypothetical protein